MAQGLRGIAPVAAKKIVKKAAKPAPKKAAKPAQKLVKAKPAAKSKVKSSAKKLAPLKKPAKKLVKRPVKKAASAKKPAAKPVAKPVKKVAKPAPKTTPLKKVIAKVTVKSAKKLVKPVAKPVIKTVAKPVSKLAPVKKAVPAPTVTVKVPAKQAVKPVPATIPVKKTHVKNIGVIIPVAKQTEKVALPAVKSSGKGKKPAVVVPFVVPVPVPKRDIGVRAGYVKSAKPYQERMKLATAIERVNLPEGYKPSHKEEYMSPSQIEYFRQRLLQWKNDLIEESKQTIENLKEEVRDVGDEAERATRETENSLELRTRDRYRKLINKIDSTLKRVDDGTYGYCVDTGEEIGLERMEARLTAERTLDAQERWEHLQKQMGD